MVPVSQAFFREHDPTYRTKVQYKSALWYHDEAQHEAIKAVIARLEAKHGIKIATTVDPVQDWHDAEE